MKPSLPEKDRYDENFKQSDASIAIGGDKRLPYRRKAGNLTDEKQIKIDEILASFMIHYFM